MGSNAARPDLPWWQRRGPSVLTLLAILAVFAIAAAVLGTRLSSVVGSVGADEQGEDPWTDPVGIELAGPFHIVHVPQCSAGPIVRVALWDDRSQPYWEAVGPPTPLTTFVIGAAPQGFIETVPYREPPAGAVRRLVVVRSLRGLAGVRYRPSDLRTGSVASGLPISRYTVERYSSLDVCVSDNATTTTTTGLAG